MTLPNWSGDLTIAGRGQWTRVSSVDQLARVLGQENGKVRVLGSRYTYPAQLECVDGTHGLVLDLARHEAPRFDGKHLRVTGDTRLETIWQEFHDRGLEPATCPPVITEQTVAGALSTGTHAQGILGGTLSDCISSIELMDASGTLHSISADDDVFESAVLGLGVLGVIVGVEIRGRPASQWHCGRLTFPEDELPEYYPLWNRTTVATKCWWFPEHRIAHAWIANDVPMRSSTGSLSRIVDDIRAHLLADISDRSGRTPAARTLEKFLGQGATKGTLREIFRNGIAAPQLNMEIAVPLTVFGEAFETLRRLLRESPTKLHYPVILRTTGPSRGHLSPARGVASTYFGFVSYMNPEGSIGEAQPLFDDIQRALYALGGQPHWGKYFTPELVQRTESDGFASFRDDVTRFDPHGLFENGIFARSLGQSSRRSTK